MKRVGKDEHLPDKMQGTWFAIDDATVVLVIDGSNIQCFGKTILYDHKVIDYKDGAVTVSLKVNDPGAEDAFQRANITGLVITPSGDFHAYNVKFACQFVRTDSESSVRT
jgi:hypothetical protein